MPLIQVNSGLKKKPNATDKKIPDTSGLGHWS